MNIFLRYSLLILISLTGQLALGQATQPGKTSSPNTTDTGLTDLGQLDGVDYVNNFFGLSLSVPRDWVVLSAQRRAEVGEESKKMIDAPDPMTKAQVNASIDRSTNLLSLTKRAEGGPGNASFMLIAERIPTQAIKTGKDVLQALPNLAKGTNFKVEFQDAIRTERIGGADFGVATIKTTSPYGTFMQKIYVVIKNDYALQLSFTYQDETDLPVFDAIVKSVKIK